MLVNAIPNRIAKPLIILWSEDWPMLASLSLSGNFKYLQETGLCFLSSENNNIMLERLANVSLSPYDNIKYIQKTGQGFLLSLR